MNIWPFFSDAFRSRAGAPALEAGDRRLTFDGLMEAIDRRAFDVAPDAKSRTRILIQSRDPVQVLLDVLAAWRLDCVPAVAHDSTPPAQLDAVAATIGSNIQLIEGQVVKSIERANGGGAAIHDREALILMTSGSTGAPRAVALPDSSVRLNVESIARAYEHCEDDRLLVASPLSHAYGLTGSILPGLWAGAATWLFAASTPQPALHATVRREGLTVVQGTPSFHRLSLAFWGGEPFDDVRLFTVGADVCGGNLAESLGGMYHRATGLAVYGMTEAGPRIAHIRLDDERHRRGSIGRPYSHIEWRIGEADASQPCLDGPSSVAAGPLLVRGPAVFLGYIEPEGGYVGLDDEGYLRTRDLVRQDDEGFLFLIGRSDRTFKVGDRLINPGSVERALMQIPGVMDARCRPMPHDVLGNVVAASVVVARQGGDTSRETILSACRDRLESAFVPRHLEIVESVATGPTGKRIG